MHSCWLLSETTLRHQNRLGKAGALAGVGLVEDRQHHQLTVPDQSLDGHFLPGQIGLEKKTRGVLVVSDYPTDPVDRRGKVLGTVDPDYSLTRRSG